MALGWTLVIQRSITFTCFLLVRLLFTTIQRIYWELNGTARRLRQSIDPRYYERSAQVLNVIVEHHFCEFMANTMRNFICVHDRFENPQFVIDNENVTLYTINDRNAVFVVTKDKDMRLWKSEFNSFLALAQQVYCHQLIVVPLTVFHEMAKTIGDSKSKLIFVFNTARCGSTLLTQVMEYSGRCVALSEPFSTTVVATKYRKAGDTPEIRQLVRDVIRWESRPYPSMQPPPLAYVIKVAAGAAGALPLLSDLYPESRNLFMYRDVVKAAKSLYRISYSLPSVWISNKLGQFSGAASKHSWESMGYDGRDFQSRYHDDLEMGITLSCLVMRSYLDLRSSGRVDVAAVRYEDLVSKPRETVRRIFEYCMLPADLVDMGLRGLDVDSQRNTPIAKSIIGSLPEPKLTPESTRRANALLSKNGLPLIGEEILLDGTITNTI